MKKPLTQEGPPCCLLSSGQHGRRRRSPPVTPPSLPRATGGPRPRQTSAPKPHRRAASPHRRGSFPFRFDRSCSVTDDLSVEHEEMDPNGVRTPPSRWFPILSVVCVALFATGVGPRPDGELWDRIYDVGLYNLPYLPAVAACWCAARHVRPERLAWRALAVALLLNVLANSLRTLAAGTTGNGPYPIAIDALPLVAYLLLYVALVTLIRARVPRFHPSMWLDGVIGAFGTTALGVAFLIGPYLHPADGRAALHLINLALPTMDVLLLALLVAVGAILGLRLDRSLVLVVGALLCVLVGDILLFVRTVDGVFVDGGPMDLTWLTGICLAAFAAHS